MAFDVFISHSSRDKVVADMVCGSLEANGIRCWIAPRDIPAGANWPEAILAGISMCRAMVLVFSSHANQSKDVMREVGLAFSREIPVILFRIEDAKLSKTLTYYMQSVHWLDAITPPIQKHLSTVVRSVWKLLSDEGGDDLIATPAAARFGDARSSLTRKQVKLAPARSTSLILSVAAICSLAGLGGIFVFMKAGQGSKTQTQTSAPQPRTADSLDQKFLITPISFGQDLSVVVKKARTSEGGRVSLFACPRGSAAQTPIGEAAYGTAPDELQMRGIFRNSTVVLLANVEPQERDPITIAVPWDPDEFAKDAAPNSARRHVDVSRRAGRVLGGEGMLKRLFSIAFITVSLASVVNAAPWCGASDQENWKEFSSLFWAGSPPTGQPVVYTLAAPWCPYCAQIFKATQGKRHSFQVRYVETYPTNESHKDQIADVVMDGTEQALIKTYVQRVQPKTTMSAQQREFINETQEAVNQALFDRMGSQVKTWGSPMSFVLLKGQIQIVAGMLNIEALDRLSAELGTSDGQSPTKRFLKTGIGPQRPFDRQVKVKRDNVRLRVLPDDRALSHLCLRGGALLKADGIVNVDGTDWIAFYQNPPKSRARVFARADQFSF